VTLAYGRAFDMPPPPVTDTARTWASENMGAILGSAFARHVNNSVKSFITVAMHDAVIWSPAIPLALQHLISNPSSIPVAPYPAAADYMSTYPNDISTVRPGNLILGVPWAAMNIPMPTAYDSGHTVTMRAPAELLSDVRKWCENDVMTWFAY
jgi:hypothetical protein